MIGPGLKRLGPSLNADLKRPTLDRNKIVLKIVVTSQITSIFAFKLVFSNVTVVEYMRFIVLYINHSTILYFYKIKR
jgi:predicted nicotinamide N-methyase